jgi:hypothetical protein
VEKRNADDSRKEVRKDKKNRGADRLDWKEDKQKQGMKQGESKAKRNAGRKERECRGIG